MRQPTLIPFFAGLAVLLASAWGEAQTRPAPAPGASSSSAQADTGVRPPPAEREAPSPRKLKWRGTDLAWDQTATSATVGVGQDYLSANPTYDMTFSLRPRYYLYDDSATDVSTLGTATAAAAATKTTVSVRADFGLFREFTNSDVTTKRGEWSLTDASLLGAFVRQLYSHGDFVTLLGVQAPILTFPTSKFSYSSGRYLEVGSSLALAEQLPLLGSGSEFLQVLSLELSAGYEHWFTRAIVPTNPELNRVRTDPTGRSLPGDQLEGAAFAEHQASFSAAGEVALTDHISLSSEFSWRPYWKYALDNSTCVNIATGCVQPTGVDNPTRSSVVTLFDAELAVHVLDELSVAVGYANLVLQLGPDGKRRNILYSPDARMYLTLVAHLDELYKTATAPAASTQVAGIAGPSSAQ